MCRVPRFIFCRRVISRLTRRRTTSPRTRGNFSNDCSSTRWRIAPSRVRTTPCCDGVGNLPLAQIAVDIGFADKAYFTRTLGKVHIAPHSRSRRMPCQRQVPATASSSSYVLTGNPGKPGFRNPPRRSFPRLLNMKTHSRTSGCYECTKRGLESQPYCDKSATSRNFKEPLFWIPPISCQLELISQIIQRLTQVDLHKLNATFAKRMTQGPTIPHSVIAYR